MLLFQTQMEDLRQQMGATLSERYTSQQKGTAKMMNDYEQMRKDLAKVTWTALFLFLLRIWPAVFFS
jgi:hypothetical protein